MKKVNKKQVEKEKKIKVKTKCFNETFNQVRKQQEKERSLILKQLTQHQLSKDDMEKLISIKHSTSSNCKHQPKLQKIQAEPAIELEEEAKADNCQLQTNIFATQQFQQDKLPETQNKESYNNISDSERLIIETKRLMPDLILESFEKKPIPWHQKKDQILPQTKQYDQEINIFDDDVYDFDPTLLNNCDQSLTNKLNMAPKFINRNEKFEHQRKQLPIILQENEIIESIKDNLITLVCGETGCGKSTQIPQFIYEAGFTDLGIIGITQPRRLATISLAQRLAEECNFKLGNEISYQVKHETSGFNEQTFLKFNIIVYD